MHLLAMHLFAMHLFLQNVEKMKYAYHENEVNRFQI